MVINIAGKQYAGNVVTRRQDTAWGGRESKAVTIEADYETALALFANDVSWSVTVQEEAEDGTTKSVTTDMSIYAISGPITDNRDGTVTIRMGKYSDDELMQETLCTVPADHAQAKTWRQIIEIAVQSIEDDAVALTAAPLYPAWDKLVAAEKTAEVGMRIQHEGKLYKVISEHTFTENYKPGDGTESLFTRIDEAHKGTEDDPIPYDGNMELIEGLYYIQENATYRCIRSTGTPVYHALVDLTGLYVEAVS